MSPWCSTSISALKPAIPLRASSQEPEMLHARLKTPSAALHPLQLGSDLTWGQCCLVTPRNTFVTDMDFSKSLENRSHLPSLARAPFLCANTYGTWHPHTYPLKRASRLPSLAPASPRPYSARCFPPPPWPRATTAALLQHLP